MGKSKLRKKIRQEIMALILENKTATEIMIAIKEKYNFDAPLSTVKHYQEVNKKTGWRGGVSSAISEEAESLTPSNNGDIIKEVLRQVLELKMLMRQELIKSRAEIYTLTKRKKKPKSVLPIKEKKEVLIEEEKQSELDDLIDKQIKEQRKKELERLIKEQGRDAKEEIK